jgi:hypothetical protein
MPAQPDTQVGPNQRNASMDKKIVGVVGAITGLASLDGAAQAATPAAPSPDLNARSYAELLDPIPNALAALRAADAAAREAPAVTVMNGEMQVAEHHHHHHHRYYHHHHHHHHRVIIVRPPRIYHHHHHHHHHHHY